MQKTLISVVLALACVLLAGCGTREQVEGLTRELELTRERVAELEDTNRAIGLEIAALKEGRSSDLSTRTVASDEEVSRFMSVFAGNIDSIVSAQLDERIGTPDDMSAILAETVQDELAANEARKKDAEREKRQKWRQDAERRRKEWSDDRAAKLATELQLTDQQQEQVKSANAEMAQQLREAMQTIRESGDWSAAAGTMADIRQSNSERMGEIMTEEQYTVYTNRQANQVRSIMDLFGGGSGRTGRNRTGE